MAVPVLADETSQVSSFPGLKLRSDPGHKRDSPIRAREPLRRRPTPAQGHALEILGHAIEYLVDSRISLLGPEDLAAEQLAARLLMQASRNVFSECAEAVPMRQRLKLWIQSPFASRAN